MDRTTLCFAHPTYRLAEEFATRQRPEAVLVAKSVADLEAVLPQVDVLCVSNLWRPGMSSIASRLRLIQATSSGVNQFDAADLHARGVRLCSARGLNAQAVAEHGIGLMLSATRQLALARDAQREHRWRGLRAERALRERELHGGTVCVVGLGQVGLRLTRLARAFGMRTIGVGRPGMKPLPEVDVAVPVTDLRAVLREADFVCLTCALTPQTEHLINSETLSAMKPNAWLVNLARGRIVDTAALICALDRREIAGACLDCFDPEPLSQESPLWNMQNVIITPHCAGETSAFERRVIDQLIENLRNEKLRTSLINEIVWQRSD